VGRGQGGQGGVGHALWLVSPLRCQIPGQRVCPGQVVCPVWCIRMLGSVLACGMCPCVIHWQRPAPSLPSCTVTLTAPSSSTPVTCPQNFPRFTAWMGVNSTSTKQRRLLGELTANLSASGHVSAPRSAVRLSYVPALRAALTLPLVAQAEAAIPALVELMRVGCGGGGAGGGGPLGGGWAGGGGTGGREEVVVGCVWCGVVWCGVVWCGVVWCGVVWCASTAGLVCRLRRAVEARRLPSLKGDIPPRWAICCC
jgi:hypothetical protein